MAAKYENFAEFYPFYLSEHSNRTNRRLHFTGSTGVLLLLAYLLFTQSWGLLVFLPVVGYGFAWIGHFFVEKNKPASFKQPWFSFMADWVMYKDILTGKIPF
ncbi:MAG: DUF962 domain-containing protein [Deltaproteobacteria bacterium]|nr:DUF962 domain-containing protein [Deltaproteobacteria bacterium]